MPRATGAPRPPIDDAENGARSWGAHDPEDQPLTALDAAPLALVVDDDPEIRDLVGEVLDELGLQTLAIADPEAVVDLRTARRSSCSTS